MWSLSWFRKQITIALIVELLIFGTTIVIACIYNRQLSQMTISNSLSREALQSVQRAFVSATKIQESRGTDATRGKEVTWDFSAEFENSGQTRAILIIGDFHVEELPHEPDGAEFIGTKPSLPSMTSLAAKEQSTTYEVSLPESLIFGTQFGPTMTGKDLTKAKFNEHIHAWGWVLYRDVFFPKTPVHLTEFSFRLNKVAVGTGGAVFVFGRLNRHNCEDQDCDDYDTIVKRYSNY